MKLATYQTALGVEIGFAINGQIIALKTAWEKAGLQNPPATMLALIEAGTALQPSLQTAYGAAQTLQTGVPAEEVQLLPPVRGYKILSVAINNDRVAKLASVAPEHPPFFLKPTSALIGHGQSIIIRPDYGLTHPEAELAVIIGKHAKHLTPETAMDVVFGYTIINDITSITLKSQDTYVYPSPGITPPPAGFEWGDMQLAYHARSKGTDTFGPLGPWIVTKDELTDPDHLAVNVFMGDELVTTDNTANLRFKLAEVLVWATRYFTLEPGDIIHLGTAAAGRYALRELDLQVWDGPLAVEIEGIGRISNPIERVDLQGNRVAAKPATAAMPWPPRFVTEKA